MRPLAVTFCLCCVMALSACGLKGNLALPGHEKGRKPAAQAQATPAAAIPPAVADSATSDTITK